MADALDWLQRLLLTGGLSASREHLPDIVPGMPGGGYPAELPSPSEEELALGGVAGAMRYRNRVLGRDVNLSAPRPYWGGDPGIYGGARPVTPGLDEVLRGPLAPFLPSQSFQINEDLGQVRKVMRRGRLLDTSWQPGGGLNQMMPR